MEYMWFNFNLIPMTVGKELFQMLIHRLERVSACLLVWIHDPNKNKWLSCQQWMDHQTIDHQLSWKQCKLSTNYGTWNIQCPPMFNELSSHFFSQENHDACGRMDHAAMSLQLRGRQDTDCLGAGRSWDPWDPWDLCTPGSLGLVRCPFCLGCQWPSQSWDRLNTLLVAWSSSQML